MSTGVPEPVGVIAQYNLLELLEPSGPGDVYRARDTRLGRTVSVRVLPAGCGGGPEGLASLLEQARGTIGLSHPNMTAVFDAGEHAGRAYLVFEYLKGQSLRLEMAGRPIRVRRAVDLAVQVADALASAQAAGFLHAGLSPESIVVTAKGHAKVPVFALASPGGFAPGDGDARLHDYDSPEEARGAAADERSDVYSAGAVLYEMLTARRPLHKGASAPSASNPQVPGELDAVVLKAVAPNPDLRLQTAAALAAELRTVAAQLAARDTEVTAARDIVPAAPVGRVFGFALAGIAILGAIAWWLLGR